MFLILGTRALEIPVLPEKLTIKSDGTNRTETVLGLGGVNIPDMLALREVSWDSVFPAQRASYVSGTGTESPSECLQLLQDYRATLKPLRLKLIGTELDINRDMLVESLEYEERGGEIGDIYYTITLREWRDYSARKVTIKSATTVVISDEPRAAGASAPNAKTVTVAPGDSLWAIAQRQYQDGSQYAAIYAKNQTLIDAANKGKRVSKYTIYAGQVLTI